MKKIILSFFLGVTALRIYAAAPDSAAQAWQSLTNFTLSPPPSSWQTNLPTQADIDKFDDHRAAESAGLAEKARDFYTAFPKNGNAMQAQVMEIQALQMAVRLGMTNRTDEMMNRERTLAQNTNAPMELRYELRVDLVGRDLKAHVEDGADPIVEMEKAGRSLVKEFPNEPMGYELLINVSGNVDLAKMQELGNLMAKSGGPPELTDMGRTLLNQLGIIGKPSPVEFTAADGHKINTTTLSNKVVLVDFWATWCPICVASMPELKTLYRQYHTNGLEIVGINFDDNTNQAQQFVKEKDISWPQYFGGYGPINPYGREYGESLPYVWLVDKKGIVRDIHGRVNMEAKIQKLLAEK